jgi:hypothetical protein
VLALRVVLLFEDDGGRWGERSDVLTGLVSTTTAVVQAVVTARR